MKVIIRGIAWTLVVLLFLAVPTHLGFGQNPRKRLLDWHPLPPVPVPNSRLNGQPTESDALQLLGITVEGRPVTLGQPFNAGPDWLKTLTLHVKNVSAKPIKFIRISFYVPEAKFKDSTLGFNLEFGTETSNGVELSYGLERLMPGQDVQLVRDPNRYNWYRDVLANAGVNTDFSRVFIGLTYLRFEDGIAWDSIRLNSVAKTP